MGKKTQTSSPSHILLTHVLLTRPPHTSSSHTQVPHWPALHKWTDDYLTAAFANTHVTVGNYDMTYDQYTTYCQRCGDDEMPLYLFDKRFVDKAPQLGGDYMVCIMGCGGEGYWWWAMYWVCVSVCILWRVWGNLCVDG